ncbi:MAG: PrgI family protein [Candidatus Daviesbacteria bacterium]|nr:PrgI family protein [Candidatus Daviesbacteria bacterium]
MEAHPVPQNVTSFEFHLVGDMTLKQFAYLASGLVSAYIIFIVFFSTYPYIAVPIIALLSGSGAALAFLPIGDRALDHWLLSFFRSIFSPTKRSWASPGNFRANKGQPNPLFQNRLRIYLAKISGNQVAPIPKFNNPPLPIGLRRITPPQPIRLPIPPVNQPQPQPVVVASLPIQTTQPQPQPVTLQPIQPQTPSPAPVVNTSPPVPLKVETPKAKVTPAPSLPRAQIVLTSSPNVPNGIVTDVSGNYLEGVIAIIHNQDGLPVRALKTNRLGQFTGATPLPPGTYTISIEKEPYQFSPIQINLTGQVLAPLSVAAKKGVATT